jgi:hypothetical protein
MGNSVVILPIIDTDESSSEHGSMSQETLP